MWSLRIPREIEQEREEEKEGGRESDFFYTGRMIDVFSINAQDTNP